MRTLVSEWDVARADEDYADVLEHQPRLNLFMRIGTIFCISGALWFGIYNAVVALLG